MVCHVETNHILIPNWGMFVKKKKNRSGSTSVVVAEKTKGRYSELTTIGIAHEQSDVDGLVAKGREGDRKRRTNLGTV